MLSLAEAEKNNWVVISIKDDWKNIYPGEDAPADALPAGECSWQ